MWEGVSKVVMTEGSSYPPSLQIKEWSILLVFPQAHSWLIPSRGMLYLIRMASWNCCLDSTKPHSFSGRVDIHDDAPFSDNRAICLPSSLLPSLRSLNFLCSSSFIFVALQCCLALEMDSVLGLLVSQLFLLWHQSGCGWFWWKRCTQSLTNWMGQLSLDHHSLGLEQPYLSRCQV